ncbi:MAG: hypothetical protein IPG53_11965 [Ignavibacteriales bacterium]|nr:hypothetical protein [Ignavibacteriales bacterium]
MPFSPTGDSVVSVGGFGLIQSRMGANATPTAHTTLTKQAHGMISGLLHLMKLLSL